MNTLVASKKRNISNAFIEVPVEEYNKLKKAYQKAKEDKLAKRIKEAEDNLKKGNVKKMSSDDFIKKFF